MSLLTEFAEVPANVSTGAAGDHIDLIAQRREIDRRLGAMGVNPGIGSAPASNMRRPPVVLGFAVYSDKALSTPVTITTDNGYKVAKNGGTLYFVCKLDVPFQGLDLIAIGASTALAPLVITSVRSNGKRAENMVAEPGVPATAFSLLAPRRFGLQMQPTPQNSTLIVEVNNPSTTTDGYINLAIAGDCFGCQGPDVDPQLVKSPPVVLGFAAFTDKALTTAATFGAGGYVFPVSGTLYFACKLDVDFRGFDILASSDTDAHLSNIVIGSVRSNGKRRENMIAEPGVPASTFNTTVYRRFGLNMWPTEQNSTLIIEATDLSGGGTVSANFAVAGTCYDCNVCTTGSCP